MVDITFVFLANKRPARLHFINRWLLKILCSWKRTGRRGRPPPPASLAHEHTLRGGGGGLVREMEKRLALTYMVLSYTRFFGNRYDRNSVGLEAEGFQVLWRKQHHQCHASHRRFKSVIDQRHLCNIEHNVTTRYNRRPGKYTVAKSIHLLNEERHG